MKIRHPQTTGALLLFGLLLAQADLAWAATASKGKSTYDMNCAMCHGDTGQGVMPGTPDFTRKEGLFATDLALVKRIEKGDRACPAFEGILKQSEILDLIAYLRTL